MARQAFEKSKKFVPADKNKTLWCPFCPWHMIDVYANRRRFGQHVVTEHYDDVAYPNGERPEPIEELK